MFESAYLKIDRAEKHVLDLQVLLDKYANAARIKFDPEGRFVTVHIDPRAEVNSSLLIGDAIHNLRSALDHAYWELLGIDTHGKQPERAQLQIHVNGTRDSYEGCIKGIVESAGLPQDTFALLKSLAAYDGGADELCALHSLDIRDKHKLLATVFSIASLRQCVVIKPNGTRELWDHLGTMMLVRLDGKAVIMPFGEGDRFDIHTQPKAALDILFGDVDYVQGKGVMTTLDVLEKEVRSVLSLMETMLARRNKGGQGS